MAAALYHAWFTVAELIRDIPGNPLDLAPYPHAEEVTIRIGDDRIEVSVGHRILVEDVSCADRITFVEIPRHAPFVKHARFPIQDKRRQRCRLADLQRVDRIPVRPVRIKLQVPIRRRPVRPPQDDMLRKHDTRRRGLAEGKERG